MGDHDLTNPDKYRDANSSVSRRERVESTVPLQAGVDRWCPRCGQSSITTALFCPRCGLTLVETATNLQKLVSGDEVQDFTPGAILKGKVSGVVGDDFIIELGLKSEGILERSEFDEPENVKTGDEVKVLLEHMEGDTGVVRISKRKADRLIANADSRKQREA